MACSLGLERILIQVQLNSHAPAACDQAETDNDSGQEVIAALCLQTPSEVRVKGLFACLPLLAVQAMPAT